MNSFLSLAIIIIIIIIYLAMKKLYLRFSTPLLAPIVTCTVLIAILLLSFNISYEAFMDGGIWIHRLLGPAVVAMAYPLYDNRGALKKYSIPVLTGVFIGTVMGIFSGMALFIALGMDKESILSAAPKSVTTPVAMDIAGMMGGIPSLASVYVMFAGISGAMAGPLLMRRAGIHHFIGTGMGLGCASHGIGTSKALEIGSEEAAISSISMSLSALFAAIICPYIAHLMI